MLATGWVFPRTFHQVLGFPLVRPQSWASKPWSRNACSYRILYFLRSHCNVLLFNRSNNKSKYYFCSAEHPEDSRSAQEPVGTEHNPPSAKSTVDTGSDDVASYTGQSVSDADKYQLLKHQFQPDLEYKFPKASNGRSFQHKWLRDNKPWLVYSKGEDWGFCLPCVFFATVYRGRAPGVLVSQPMKNF